MWTSVRLVRARGRRVLFFADVEIDHRRGRSAASTPAATEAAYRQSQIAFYEKHHPAWVPLLRIYLKLFSSGKSSVLDRAGSQHPAHGQASEFTGIQCPTSPLLGAEKTRFRPSKKALA